MISDLSLSLFTFKDQPPSSHREIAPFTMQLALVKFGLYILSSQFIISANVYSVCSLCSCLKHPDYSVVTLNLFMFPTLAAWLQEWQ